jgi:hypothetical protein
MARGAVLMSTESTEPPRRGVSAAKNSCWRKSDDGLSRTESERLAATILKRRDRFIANRIDVTLKPGESGILFLGLVHNLEPHLPSDIRVVHPAGRVQPAGS